MRFSAGAAGIMSAALFAAPMAMFATGCSPDATSQVAATVNGEDIYESTVTEYVQNFRKSNGLEDDKTWAQWLVDNGRDPESIRDDAIDYFVRIDVMEQDAAEKGVEVSEQEVTDQIDEIMSYYGYDQEQFDEQLAAIGYTAEGYRDYVRQSLIQEKLMDVVEGDDAEISDEDLLSQANAYTTILDGAKNISVIELFDEDEANEAGARIESGEDFAVVQGDSGSTTDYDGWDVMTGLDANVTDALTNVGEGQVSAVIPGADGDAWFIVKVNQVLSVGENGFASIDEIPESLREEFAATVKQSQASTEFEAYIQGLVDAAEVTINPMPKGLPYDVSLEGVEASTAASTTPEEGFDFDDQEFTEEPMDSAPVEDAGEVVDIQEVEAVEDGGDSVTVDATTTVEAQ